MTKVETCFDFLRGRVLESNHRTAPPIYVHTQHRSAGMPPNNMKVMKEAYSTIAKLRTVEPVGLQTVAPATFKSFKDFF